jgi:hypothetical protein
VNDMLYQTCQLGMGNEMGGTADEILKERGEREMAGLRKDKGRVTFLVLHQSWQVGLLCTEYMRAKQVCRINVISLHRGRQVER